MAGMNTLQMIKMIPKFDGENFVEWTRSFSYVLQISWHFLIKIIYGLKRPEPINRGSREGEESICAFDCNDYNPSEVSANISGY